MIRLHFVVEGQTEETFVNKVLVPYLSQFNVSADARCVETSHTKTKIYRGGMRTYQKAKRDLNLWMRQEVHNRDVCFTTMFDLYGLPNDFPQYDKAKEKAKRKNDPYQMIEMLESAFADDLGDSRFVPYIQLHEFEALLFADVTKFEGQFPERKKEIQSLVRLANEFGNPELINDGTETAPSKRIIQLIPEYEGRKVSAGPIIAEDIGIVTLREKCTHFDRWIMQLEQLDKSIPTSAKK